VIYCGVRPIDLELGDIGHRRVINILLPDRANDMLDIKIN
jgi:hypothetical protein